MSQRFSITVVIAVLRVARRNRDVEAAVCHLPRLLAAIFFHHVGNDASISASCSSVMDVAANAAASPSNRRRPR